MIHWSCCNKISCNIEINTPNWLFVLFESKCASCVDKVPNFNSWVTTCCYNMKTFWMKFHWAYPIFMSLTWHNEFWLSNTPNFPEHIIRTSTNDWFFWMEYNSTNWHCMTLLSFWKNCLFVIKWLNIICKIRIY